MNLTQLFETQKVLRERINYNEPDRFNKLVLALLVELGECANEWKGFKFWSKKKPLNFIHTTAGATPENAVMFKCMNEDECGEYLEKEDFVSLFDPDYEECPKCQKGYVNAFRRKYPLLEEYVDKLHFLLEIGLELQHTDIQLWTIKEKNITNQFIECFSRANNLYFQMRKTGEVPREMYEYLFSVFLGLGEMLGFTWEQIEQAYFEKNKINHQRQSEGY